ncbi:bifunctional DNA-binding transcriptional regulator/O6-methylguanine-DNA methyltransferase Ada [Tianweitania sp. BSSL-BM11]|uniref:Bifunctional DNA-binding transcriptional regulator/O6-methylguanine-DNA methyltransferase Ada n=1 Tax=Tianweitania aestuarii TaxID=2814886 RepID=A0ABS5RRX9_9HYPH|nr:bifunctional DNA-binding transcriptional regulator/O6-methylguanine-DNA methyltransferase Ada [Tianweitania aestuarii]MBS9719722.1 bifunctional DNA-binding transcriptional regulator/O6-methylguanine-DNA methyltransferase Ada [Tianweitania aestuarii]
MPHSSHTAFDPLADLRWKAVLDRDAALDDHFFYAVLTTGIFCRPSCPSRRAKPENVRFFATAEEAMEARFRPCLRCKPQAASAKRTQAQRIVEACKQIDVADDLPQLDTLASAAGLSPFHFHRLFKQHTGLTPRAYGAARQAEKLRSALGQGNDVTRAIYEAGFNASSRAYDQADGVLGMTPGAYKKGGTNARIHFAIGECTLGHILVAQSQKGLCAILLGDEPEILLQDLQNRFPKAELIGADPAFEETVATVVGFVEAPRIGLDLPLDIQGTAFQERVWQTLRSIPVGTTVSYAELAERIGQPSAVRAVAGACAANALAVAIPCHRVVRTDGSLSGYRWGLERKRDLLEREAQES